MAIDRKIKVMASPKQRAASRANSLRSTGPRSERGKSQAKLNATKHGLSLPVDERVFADLIQEISTLIRGDCKSDSQAYELAKRIIDFERNEIFLLDHDEKKVNDQIKEWAFDPYRIALTQIAQAHRNKQAVATTFTLPQKSQPVKLKGKEQTDEIKFIEAFLRIQHRAVLSKVISAKNNHTSAERYQKRAINQLIKGIRVVARG
jgi:hypothetical protein